MSRFSNLPPIPARKNQQPQAIPTCATQLIQFVHPGKPLPTEQQIINLNHSAKQVGQSACDLCLEDPKLNIFQKEECPAKSTEVADLFIRNSRKTENLAPRHRLIKIMQGPPKPPFERHSIPGLDQEARNMAGLAPLPDPNEEIPEPTVRQDIGYT